jgi:hypothetical protein
VDKSGKWRLCRCGNRVRVPDNMDPAGVVKCPKCESKLDSSTDAAPPAGAPPDETQTVDLNEMARMAQKGVDVGVSGEWVTPVPRKKKEPSEE